jgi:transcriptional regulator NrdR family protein
MTEEKKPRKRGGVSMPCPKCGSDSRVLQTRRNDVSEVFRDRECKKRSHRFWTIEVIYRE